MSDDKRFLSRPPGAIVRRTRTDLVGGARPATLDWPAWLALIERKRRLVQRDAKGRREVPHAYLVLATCSSFQLDGLDLPEQEVVDALARSRASRMFRSRTGQRIRNHVAILHCIESCLHLGKPLKTSAVLRWYTGISSGLSINPLGSAQMARLENLVRRINSPQLRLRQAIQDIAQTNREVAAEPLFPSFNGILSRLLLRYHLGRCGLPFVILGPASATATENASILALLNAIDQSYDLALL